MEKLTGILSLFLPAAESYQFAPIHSGHINSSFWVSQGEKPDFVLQQINEKVFPEVKALTGNLSLVSEQMQVWTFENHPQDAERRFLQFVPTTSGEKILQTETGCWRLLIAIQDSVSHEVVESPKQAYEAGKLFGEFWTALSSVSPHQLHSTIDRFHDLRWRREQLQAAFDIADDAKKEIAKVWVKNVEILWEHVSPTVQAIEKGALPQRIVHNDAKLSNMLFDQHTQEGLCVIDLDTVMAGYLLYDFGDMVRSICCPVAEDSRQLAAVSCDMQRFEALAQAYLEASASQITQLEIESLVQGGTYMSLIMGMRFLADFLQGNIYYKTMYPDHNLDRARNQITLAQDLMQREKQLDSTLNSFL